MKLNGINHITFSVSDIDKATEFYEKVFGAKLLVKGEKLSYFDLDGLWIALNVEKDIPRNDIYKSYTHISFTINESDYDDIHKKLIKLGVDIIESRPRHNDEGKSIYFRDLDGHLFEFHTKNRDDRIEHYKKTRKYLNFSNL